MDRMMDRRHLLPLLVCGTVIAGTLALVGPQQNRALITRPNEIPLRERLVRFEDGSDGSVVIRDAGNQAVLARFPVAEGGFVRGTLRALARERRQEEQGQEMPFRVSAWRDGQLTLDDVATGRRVDLTAFGSTNAGIFARLLTAQGETQ
ncbi:photosynthetic complex assembly protein PuhC [Roseococcus suduntuyensis]|uniref:Putative photosynthetic complex assembly protein n=1 Tax=Roseococcus suduntuyensis TaxID=455361 RepID=A0A840AAJ2_9PROT|nr:photosynthetic complex assembly protein PuhC [Roseococcus suduntuyensis]MBB3898117.1 putative photosynthetic complex assembly protein [Roseococcus suduntuyensis]